MTTVKIERELEALQVALGTRNPLAYVTVNPHHCAVWEIERFSTGGTADYKSLGDGATPGEAVASARRNCAQRIADAQGKFLSTKRA